MSGKSGKAKHVMTSRNTSLHKTSPADDKRCKGVRERRCQLQKHLLPEKSVTLAVISFHTDVFQHNMADALIVVTLLFHETQQSSRYTPSILSMQVCMIHIRPRPITYFVSSFKYVMRSFRSLPFLRPPKAILVPADRQR